MKQPSHSESGSSKKLHHGPNPKIASGQSIYINNKAHQESGGLDWVKQAFQKATLGTVRKLNQDA